MAALISDFCDSVFWKRRMVVIFLIDFQVVLVLFGVAVLPRSGGGLHLGFLTPFPLGAQHGIFFF